MFEDMLDISLPSLSPTFIIIHPRNLVASITSKCGMSLSKKKWELIWLPIEQMTVKVRKWSNLMQEFLRSQAACCCGVNWSPECCFAESTAQATWTLITRRATVQQKITCCRGCHSERKRGNSWNWLVLSHCFAHTLPTSTYTRLLLLFFTLAENI